MTTLGKHILVELFGCPSGVLDDPEQIQAAMQQAARDAGATEVAVVFHQFAPQGVSGVVVVEESHLSIHTWPETGYAAIDVFTCGDCSPERAAASLRRNLRATGMETMTVSRGRPDSRSMRVDAHDTVGEGCAQAPVTEA